MARIRFPGSQRPQRTQIAAMRQPQKEKDWYKDPNQLLAWVKLAEVLGSEKGLAARGVREVQAQMAEGRLEEAGMPQGPVEPSVEQQMAPLVERAMAGDPSAMQALDPMGRSKPTPPAGPDMMSTEVLAEEGFSPDEIRDAQAGNEATMAEERAGLWAPLLERQRASQAAREERRAQLEELGVQTVGDVTGALLDYYQDHGMLPNQVVRDAWMALEDAVENDPSYIREGLTVRDARQEMMQTMRLLREGKSPDELRELRIELAKINLRKEQEEEARKLNKATRSFKPSTSVADFRKKFKMDEWNKPTTERQDQTVSIGDGETLTITYGSDPSGALTQLQSLSSRLRTRSNAQKSIRQELSGIGSRLTQTERGTAASVSKEETAEEKAKKAKEEKAKKARERAATKREKELEDARAAVKKAVAARRAFFVNEGLVTVDGKTAVMNPTQKAQRDMLEADIKNAKTALRELEGKKVGRFTVREKGDE